MSEIFIPIRGYEGEYEVGNLGSIKSLKKVRFQNGKPQIYSERILRTEKTYKGYQRVMLAVNGVRKKVYVHRIVAEHFVEKPEGKTAVNHKNFRKHDNRAENLEWVTPKENDAHYRARNRGATIQSCSKQTSSACESSRRQSHETHRTY